MIHGKEGVVIDAFTMTGAIIGADIFMLLGAMTIVSLPARLSKKLDAVVEPPIPVGFELLTRNSTVALLSAVTAVIGCTWVVPVITSSSAVSSIGVSTLEDNNPLLLTMIFIKPAKVLLLDNAVEQGILMPLGATQLNGFGRSVLFLLGSNPGPGFGILLAYCFFGKGNTRAGAYGASIIHFFGSIHEVYSPLILMNPLIALAAIAGGIADTFLFTLFNTGLVGVSSPGSIVTIMMTISAGDQSLILFAALASTTVSSLVAAVIVKHSRQSDEDVNKNLKEAAKQIESSKGKKSRISSVFEKEETATNFCAIKRIVYACDAGTESSVTGAGVTVKRLRKAGITDITVEHVQVMELLDPKADVIVTYVFLQRTVHEKQSDIEIISIEDYLNVPEHDEFVNSIKATRS